MQQLSYADAVVGSTDTTHVWGWMLSICGASPTDDYKLPVIVAIKHDAIMEDLSPSTECMSRELNSNVEMHE